MEGFVVKWYSQLLVDHVMNKENFNYEFKIFIHCIIKEYNLAEFRMPFLCYFPVPGIY